MLHLFYNWGLIILSELVVKKNILSKKTDKNNKKKKTVQFVTLYLMLLPNLVLFAVMSVYPVSWALKYAFYDYDGYSAAKFNGIDNFIRVFTSDSQFWHTVVNTFVYGGMENSSYYSFGIYSCSFAKWQKERKCLHASGCIYPNYFEFCSYGFGILSPS